MRAVAARCPWGRPAVAEQDAYLPDGTPFPTTYYLTCPHAAARVSALEAAGGVARLRALAASDPEVAAQLADGTRRQRALRRPAPQMRDGGASLLLGIGGTPDGAPPKCLHAHVAFALAEPGYALGARIADGAGDLFPSGRCCTP